MVRKTMCFIFHFITYKRRHENIHKFKISLNYFYHVVSFNVKLDPSVGKNLSETEKIKEDIQKCIYIRIIHIRIKTMFGSSSPPIVCRRVHVLFTLVMFICVQWFPTHIVLCFCLVFLHLVYHMLSLSLDCPFLIALSVFSNVYIHLKVFHPVMLLKVCSLFILTNYYTKLMYILK